MKLEDYQKQLKEKTCRWCNTSLEKEPIQHYEHPGGLPVDGYPTKRWIYVVCPECKHQWSWAKLGFQVYDQDLNQEP